MRYSDIDFVQGVFCKDSSMQKALYLHCRDYFFTHYGAVFFAQDCDAEDIFEDAFITLWQNIEEGKLRVVNGIVLGRNGDPFRGNLTSYLMGIAKLKYCELVRGSVNWIHFGDIDSASFGEPIVEEWTEDDYAMHDALSECISKLSERCSQILELFYEQHKNLDEMLFLIPTFQSKDALKTAKNKCLNKLRDNVNELMRNHLA